MKKIQALLEKPFTLKQLKTPLLCCFLLIVAAAFMADSCSSQTTQSQQNAQTASGKWGNSPAITEYYEYHQLQQIYEARDNPKLVLNAYLFSPQTGDFTCLGKVAGYGVPYGTQWSQPNASGGAVPEPNGLYPSENTDADWVWVINDKGEKKLTFLEPNVVITEVDYPCHHLKGD